MARYERVGGLCLGHNLRSYIEDLEKRMRDAAARSGMLQWAWLAAGVPSLLCPRWSADEAVSTATVVEFHRALAGIIGGGDQRYVALAAVAFMTGWIASNYGLRPYPFYIGIAMALVGLILSWLFVRDTQHHVKLEAKTSALPLLKNVFWETTWKHKDLGSITQAGLVNNLNDGLAWGLFPIAFAAAGLHRPGKRRGLTPCPPSR